MVAAEQEPLRRQGVAEMVGGVPGRMNGLDLPRTGPDAIAGAQAQAGMIVAADRMAPGAGARFRRTVACGHGPGQACEGVHSRAVVGMAVSQEDMADPFAASGEFAQQRRAVGVVVRPGVDHGHRAASDDVGVGPLEGHRSRIVGDEAAQTGGDLAGDAVFEMESQFELRRRFHAHLLLHGFVMTQNNGWRQGAARACVDETVSGNFPRCLSPA